MEIDFHGNYEGGTPCAGVCICVRACVPPFVTMTQEQTNARAQRADSPRAFACLWCGAVAAGGGGLSCSTAGTSKSQYQDVLSATCEQTTAALNAVLKAQAKPVLIGEGGCKDGRLNWHGNKAGAYPGLFPGCLCHVHQEPQGLLADFF